MKDEINASMRLSKLLPGVIEEEALLREFEQIVGYFDCLQEVDTDGVEPMVQPTLSCLDDLRQDVKHDLLIETHGWNSRQNRTGSLSLFQR